MIRRRKKYKQRRIRLAIASTLLCVSMVLITLIFLAAFQKGSEQAPAEDDAGSVAKEVRECMKRSFNAYRRDAWGSDEYRPLTAKGEDSFGGNGLTIIDSLDTLFMMGLDEEFAHARAYVRDDFTLHGSINVFEHTIRVLGGLLSTYSLSGDEIFLTKAVDVGNVLLRAFDENSVIPCGHISSAHHYECRFNRATNAEVGTLSLEFTSLSRFTGDDRWVSKIRAINRFWQSKKGNLLKMTVDRRTLRMSGRATMGGGIDSTYEYFIKLYEMNKDREMLALYESFEDLIVQKLLPKPGDELEHLACFAGGCSFLVDVTCRKVFD